MQQIDDSYFLKQFQRLCRYRRAIAFLSSDADLRPKLRPQYQHPRGQRCTDRRNTRRWANLNQVRLPTRSLIRLLPKRTGPYPTALGQFLKLCGA